MINYWYCITTEGFGEMEARLPTHYDKRKHDTAPVCIPWSSLEYPTIPKKRTADVALGAGHNEENSSVAHSCGEGNAGN